MIEFFDGAPEDRERLLEAAMRDQGAARYRARIRKAKEQGRASVAPAGSHLVREAIEAVAENITEFLTEASAKGRGPFAGAVPILSKVDPWTAAFLGLRVVIDTLTEPSPLGLVAVKIGRRLADEVRFAELLGSLDPTRSEILLENVRKATSYRHIRNVAVHFHNLWTEQDGQPRYRGFEQAEVVRAGLRVVEAIIDRTGYCLITMRREGKKTTRFLEMTDELVKWVTDFNARNELLAPVSLPMIIPPRPWTGPRTGGYHFPELVGQAAFVKTRFKAHRELVADAFDMMPTTVNAINLIQATPWRVNRRVLDVAIRAWQDGIPINGIPTNADLPLPPKPHDIDTNAEARRGYSREAFPIHDFNARSRSQRLMISRVLYVAEQFADEAEIFFPHQVDFRGRAYAMPWGLSPQGPDLSRGLLEFAEGKPVETAEAARWLHIHTANTWGMDKLSLDERELWTIRNRGMIEAIALRPHSALHWTKADSPFQFLAACFALADFWFRPGEVCRLPVAMDATCSGIQHFSAMALDEVGGEAVNLVPSERRRDIYADVAERFARLLKHAAEADFDRTVAWHSADGFPVDNSQAAEWWLSLDPDRSLAKRPVMVVPYGGKFQSTIEYTFDWLARERRDNIPWPEADMRKAAAWGASRLWQAINETIVGARDVMTFCQKCAAALDDTDEGLVWVTPTGFPVFMAYRQFKQTHIKSVLGTEQIRIYQRGIGGPKNKAKTRNSVAPNFVHSMDAAHLALTVEAASKAGIKHFAMIHDSFATHAADAVKLAAILRQTFAEMYSADVLEHFRLDLMDQATPDGRARFPASFERGSLDIQAVRRSTYFFS